jgi:hypothetical protein
MEQDRKSRKVGAILLASGVLVLAVQVIPLVTGINPWAGPRDVMAVIGRIVDPILWVVGVLLTVLGTVLIWRPSGSASSKPPTPT